MPCLVRCRPETFATIYSTYVLRLCPSHACLLACLSARLPACLPASLPASLAGPDYRVLIHMFRVGDFRVKSHRMLLSQGGMYVVR